MIEVKKEGWRKDKQQKMGKWLGNGDPDSWGQSIPHQVAGELERTAPVPSDWFQRVKRA